MMKLVKTDDGSFTYFSEKWGETYHSISGAFEEALLKYVYPCKIFQKSGKGKINILDVCFGLGYNSLFAINECKKNENCNFITIYGLEADIEILKKILELNIPSELNYSYEKIKNIIISEKLEYQDENFYGKILLGDARETINLIPNSIKFDAVFFDPFSPARAPELWNEDFLKEIKKYIYDDGIISTYSCARLAKNAFINAGFFIKEGPIVGKRRNGGIIASLNREILYT